MQTNLPIHLAVGYRSRTQIARVVSEHWVSENMYCLSCDSEQLWRTRAGTRVYDFTCYSCEERYQLKSRSASFGRRVVDAAYEPMVDAIKKSRVPNFFFLRYRRDLWKVCDFFAVPAHFISLSTIEERRPLSPTARRKRWKGCNILLDRIPSDGRVSVIEKGEIRRKQDVRRDWRRFSFLKESSWRARGWTSDVLACVRRLGREEFTLRDIYAFEAELRELHPKNKHIRPKIRQQLQVLRDEGILDFLGGGNYRILELGTH